MGLQTHGWMIFMQSCVLRRTPGWTGVGLSTRDFQKSYPTMGLQAHGWITFMKASHAMPYSCLSGGET